MFTLPRAETDIILPSTKSKGRKQKAERERERDRDRDGVEPVERERGDQRRSPSTPSTQITDADEIDDVDISSVPIAPQPSDKSPAPARTQSANFIAAMGGNPEVRAAWLFVCLLLLLGVGCFGVVVFGGEGGIVLRFCACQFCCCCWRGGWGLGYVFCMSQFVVGGGWVGGDRLHAVSLVPQFCCC